MTFIYWLGAAYTLAIFVYLVFALFAPERF
jgi:K+-transporting ATPase KdpF subunit